MGFHHNRCADGACSAGRSAAGDHFLRRDARGFASNDDSACADPSDTHLCRFSVFRTDSVGMTASQFAGGDWRWHLSDSDGAMLVEAGGYRQEAQCRKAVAVLRAHAARAIVD